MINIQKSIKKAGKSAILHITIDRSHKPSLVDGANRRGMNRARREAKALAEQR
jgi:hypothetical protein